MISTKYFDDLQSVSVSLSRTNTSLKAFVMERIGFSPCEVNCVNMGIKHKPLPIEKKIRTTGARKVLKTCKSCERDKKKSEFGTRKESKDGLQYVCLKCKSKFRFEYNKQKEDFKEKSRARYYAKKEADFNRIINHRL